MTILSFPQIVTDGLVLCLDAGNQLSYPGTGTTWTDLTRNKNNGALTNGPTFSGAGGGTIVFDGTNDYIAINNGNGFNIGKISTAMMWVLFKSYNTILIGSNQYEDSGYLMYVENSSNIYIADASGFINTNLANLSINIWIHLTVVRNNSNISWYKNSVPIGTATLSGSNNNNIIKGIGAYNGGGYRLNGNISQTLIYNRALTQNEVLRNYLATKGRFGL